MSKKETALIQKNMPRFDMRDSVLFLLIFIVENTCSQMYVEPNMQDILSIICYLYY